MINMAYLEDSLARGAVIRWYKAFLENRKKFARETRTDRPSTSSSDMTRVREILNTGRRLSVRLVAQMLGIPKCIVHKIVTQDL